MRELEATLSGTEIKLAATFKAGVDLSQKVADPLYIAREATLEVLMSERGLPYTPKWMFTTENIPVIIHIGMKAAGSNKTLEQVQEMVFDEGFPNARAIAMEYIGLLVGPTPEEVDSKEEGSSEGN